MKKIKKFLKGFKQKYGLGAILLPLGALVVGGGLVLWGLYYSGFDVLKWATSSQAITIYIVAAVVACGLLVLWGMS